MKKLFCTLLCSLAMSATQAVELLDIQQQWAKVNYQVEKDAREQAFLDLIEQANGFVSEHPDDAAAHIWLGIIESSAAGAIGGLSALDYAENAKTEFEKAISLDETALQGSAFTSLGTLYHKVPGWPIGFGSNKKAAKMLEKALQINPQGIDPNFFYAELMYSKRKYQDAKRHLLIAQNAPARIDRPIADSERQKEVAELLAKVEKKLN